jgi:hypothetical protein
MIITEDDVSKAKRQFNLNYKSFLENKLLFQTLHDIAQSQVQNSTGIQSALGKRVEEHFLKSYLSASSQLNSEQKSLIIDTKLDLESKGYLLKKCEQSFQNILDELTEYLKFADNGEPSRSFNYPLDTNSSLLDVDKIVLKINNLIVKQEQSRSELTRLTNENTLKQQSLFTQSIETINFLFKMLKELKLDFYNIKNQIDCEHEISECDMLLGKMQTVTDNLKLDLYDNQSLQVLAKIQSQIENDSIKVKEEHNKVVGILDLYLSLGDSFKVLLKEYTTLKESIERKKWQINQFQ